MTSPFLILIDGPMGSGKTTTSTLLNQKLPDTARVALPDIKRLVPIYRENENAPEVARAVMHAMIATYLKHGVSVIVEHISKADGVARMREIATTHGAHFYAYRLTAPKETRRERVQGRTKEMMSVTTLPQEKINELKGYFEPNDQFYHDNPSPEAETIDTAFLSPDEVTEIITSKLERSKGRILIRIRS